MNIWNGSKILTLILKYTLQIHPNGGILFKKNASPNNFIAFTKFGEHTMISIQDLVKNIFLFCLR